MSKLWLVRVIPIGAGLNFDCWFRSETSARGAYDAACKRRANHNTDKSGNFLGHDIADDFGARHNFNILACVLVFTDTETSLAIASAVGFANQQAQRAPTPADAAKWFEQPPKGSS